MKKGDSLIFAASYTSLGLSAVSLPLSIIGALAGVGWLKVAALAVAAASMAASISIIFAIGRR